MYVSERVAPFLQRIHEKTRFVVFWEHTQRYELSRPKRDVSRAVDVRSHALLFALAAIGHVEMLCDFLTRESPHSFLESALEYLFHGIRGVTCSQKKKVELISKRNV